jgi:hypothetical protein
MGAIAAGVFTSFFTGIFEYLAKWFSKKVALGAAVIAGTLALSLALWAALKVAVLGLMFPITNEYVIMGLTALWPPNAEACIAAVWTAHLAAWLYREHLRNFVFIAMGS